MSQKSIAHYEARRDNALKRLKDASSCAAKARSDSTLLPRLETWCSRIDSILDSFTAAVTNLTCESIKAGTSADEVHESQSAFIEQADDFYAEVIEARREFSVKSEPKAEAQSRETVARPRLPAIKLPIYTGQIKEFPGFIDLFNTLVHNRSDLSNVEKFQYLITSLAGEPINIIRAFPVSDVNYVSAYTALVDRYNNKRVLAFRCWEQINNLKPMSSGSAQSLRGLLDTYSENLSVLDSLGLPTSQWDFVLFHSLLTKLDKASREAFELSNTGGEFPSFKDLKIFLVDRCNALERSTLSNNYPSSSSTSQSNINKRVNNNPAKSTILLTQTNQCVMCKEAHPLYSCSKFLSKAPFERSQIVRQNKLCFNCLRSNHTTANCSSKHTCKTCNQRHNSLIHYSRNTEASGPALDSHPRQSNINSIRSGPSLEGRDEVITPVTSLSNIASGASSNHFVLLATAEVEVKDGVGSYQKVRALLDPGSQSHIITKTCARRLGLTQYKSQTPMSGIGQAPTLSTSKVFLEVRPVGKSGPTFTTEAVTLDKICGNMPTHSINIEDYKHVSNIKLADEKYHLSRPVDILIGGEFFPQILLPGKLEGGPHVASAINTIFGFILMGRTPTSSPTTTLLSINQVSIDTNLDIAIQKFWELDNIPCGDTKQSQSSEDIQCENIFQSTHKRATDGRYVVHLPFRDQSPPAFLDAYSIALRRFIQLEKRLLAKPEFHQQYTQHVMEYLSTDQMNRVPEEECQSPTAFYLAHHAVTKADRSLRVVYDASMKDRNGVSLNSTLLTGARLQADITNILLRFRLHAVVFCADIRQMYRQIRVTREHQDYQRILFRCSPDQPVQEFKLNRVTFGVSSAPFLAIRVLHQLAKDEGESYPAAARVLMEDIYVDDAVTGCSNIEEATILQKQLIDILAAGGFELRKWSSNHKAILHNVPEEHKAVPKTNQTFDSDTQFVKVLGLAWNSEEDIFTYQVNQINRECTKRTMLSGHGGHRVVLVSARSRVAPTKRRTLPRLELCGAVLLADLMRHIINLYHKILTIESIHAWTDSMIVLSWIRSQSSNFQAFVGNRISDIQRKLPEAVWNHVPGKLNPADAASRGLTPEELIKHDQWWTGPSWLSMDREQWPIQPQLKTMSQYSDPEVKSESRTCVLNVSDTVDLHPVDYLLTKFSSLRKIQRIFAYCNRFIKAMRKNRYSGHFNRGGTPP